MKRMTIGVILGGLVFFVWGAVSWMVLPFHNKTVSALPEEQLITDTLKVVIKDPGFYCFPHQKAGEGMDQKTWEEKMRKGPSGVLVINPDGREPMSGTQFLNGFLIGIIASFVCMLILAFSRDRIQGLGARVLLLVGVGVMGWMVSDLSYWNWFGFPCYYTLANLVDWVVNFALLGVVLNKFVPSYE